MFAGRFFAARAFAPRYFPRATGAVVTPPAVTITPLDMGIAPGLAHGMKGTKLLMKGRL